MKILSIFAVILIFALMGCSEEDELVTMSTTTTSQLTLNINGLEDLGSTAVYEGWIIIPAPAKSNSSAAGTPVSTGTFTVNANGELSQTKFDIDADDLANATTFILTIEPNPDSDSNPSSVHILAGDFSNDLANINVSHGAALGDDFSSSTGEYILATPTNGADTDENSGIWFLSLTSGSPAQGLNLPTLPDGWTYEGWVVINGTPVTTGTFLNTTVVDDADPYSSTMPGPPFPGEDFLINAPMNLNFPIDIMGGVAVISIEPSPDNSPNPFTLKPLVGNIPVGAVDHTTYMMNTNLLSFPSGSVTR